MDAREAFKLFNELAIAQTNTSLNQLEKDIFLGIWEGKTYQEISEECYRAFQTVKEAGPKLFKKIQANWNINHNLNKNNFKLTIEPILQQHFEVKENAVPQQTITQVDILQLTNPFFPLTGKIDKPQLFFNRDKEIKEAFNIFSSGSNPAFIGESKIGKSSLLLTIQREAKTRFKPQREAIYLDLQKIQNPKEFYAAFCDEIQIETTEGYSLTRILENRGILLLLLLDEVEKIKGDDFAGVRSYLGGLADGGSNPLLRLVVAARSPLDDLFPDIPGQTSPFCRHFTPVNIPCWNEETMRDFIASRLNSPLLKPGAKSVNFTEEEIARVMAESGGHPQKLMQFCNQIYADYLEE